MLRDELPPHDDEHTVCQIGVFAAYVSDKGHAFIDRRLYLPKAWTDDPARLTAAHVPAAVGFATMIGSADHPFPPGSAPRRRRRRAAAGGRHDQAGDPCWRAVRPSAACGSRSCGGGSAKGRWAATDSVYGVGEVETALRQAGKGYVLGVTGSHFFSSWGKEPAWSGTAEAIAARLPPSAYVRLSAGEGTKGPRLYDWAYLELADLAADVVGYLGGPEVWTRGLLIRRSLADQSLAFFTTWSPKGTPLKTLVRVEGCRWATEDAFETAKTELGLDHNETRSWHGWHRHVSLVMLAFALLAVIRHRANTTEPPPKSVAAAGCRQWCAGPSRRSATSSAG